MSAQNRLKTGRISRRDLRPYTNLNLVALSMRNKAYLNPLIEVLDPYRISQCMRSPKLCGRVRGVVVRFDLSMVAMDPRSMISGESDDVNENVLVVNEWSFLEMKVVLRKPKPCLRSVSVKVTLLGELCRMESTGRSLGMVDCEVCSERR